MSEQQLVEQVRSAIKRNPHLRCERVLLEANEGRVVLRGTVRSWFQKQMAQESLRGIEGVHEIENLLEVHWPSRQPALAD